MEGVRYKVSKYKYLALKNMENQHAGGKSKSELKGSGLMVQAPMGTGKSYYLEHRVPSESRDQIVDGDELLDSLQIKNRNYFWYDESKEVERQKILEAFRTALDENKIILYSGSPEYIPTDVLVVPDSKVRWDRLQNRDDFRPKREQFDREQKMYEEYRSKVPIVFNSDLPDFAVLCAIRDSF